MNAYEQLIAHLKELAKLKSTLSLLGWDEQTQMPPKAAAARAEQMSLLASLIHARETDPRVGQWLGECEQAQAMNDPHGDFAVNVRQTRLVFDRQSKLPAEWVEEMTRVSVLAKQAWMDARQKSSFAVFAPWLGRILDLKKRQVAYLRKPGQAAYDVLLDEFEPQETVENLRRVFDSLRGPLVELVGRIANSSRRAPLEILERNYPIDLQRKLALQAAKAIGFDFEAGRLDVSVHPFSTEIGPGDARITTRYDENYFGDGFFGTLHETGHAMYSQGLPAEHFGTPRGEYVSLGIHESQSRMWENLVGRSRPFWKFFFPKIKAAFGQTLANVSEDDWFFAINDVRPSLIRTESDEATYNLHVLLRFELEQAMINGELPVAQIPSAWNERMQKYLGVVPPDDARGCLQDIHWSGGAIGYFPTYTLGNLYAAQFFAQAREDLKNLNSHFEHGDFAPLLEWLRTNIHSQGQKYSAAQLVKKVTGHELSADPLLKYLRGKASELYGV